jgi:putrescine transport system ATP-binding protein
MALHYKKKRKLDELEKKPILVIENVSKKYLGNDYKTLENINLEVYEGEFFALLGPSGCGKTTLMRMIAGFETPTTGTVKINGVDMSHVPPYKRPVNMMFQSYALFPHMDVWDNISFGLKQEKLSKEEIEKKVTEVLEIVKMTPFAWRKPYQLSGGQQQRVALARSLVKQPKLLLLDEPLGALDRQTREETQIELNNIQHMLGVTFIVVTHDQEEAMSMASRMAVMNKGNLMQVGSAEEIYEKPNSKFVAEFIGSINLFYGEILHEESNGINKVVKSEELGIEIIVEDEDDIAAGCSEAWVAVRPEEIEIDSVPTDIEENEIRGVIIDIGFLGETILYHVRLNSGKIVQVSVPTANRSINQDLFIGEEAYLSWYYSDGMIVVR